MLTSIELVKVSLPVQQVQAGLLELCPRINNLLRQRLDSVFL